MSDFFEIVVEICYGDYVLEIMIKKCDQEILYVKCNYLTKYWLSKVTAREPIKIVLDNA